MFFRVTLFVWRFVLDLIAMARMTDDEKDLEIMLLRQQLRIVEVFEAARILSLFCCLATAIFPQRPLRPKTERAASAGSIGLNPRWVSRILFRPKYGKTCPDVLSCRHNHLPVCDRPIRMP
jgi:hypothetical protein